MTIHKSTFVKRILAKVIAPLAITSLLAPVAFGTAQAKPKAKDRSAPISGFRESTPWYGKRPLLLLPLQYSDDFNVDKEQFDSLLSYAEQAIQKGLVATDKFSVFQINEHSPTLMRAVLDEKVTQDQVDTLVKSPTLENANAVLKAMQFDTPPMIAIFSLGKVSTYNMPPKKNTPQAPIVQAQVSGKLYDLGNTTAIKSVELTSNVDPKDEMDFWPNDRILLAIDNAAAQVANRFVAPPAPVDLPVPAGSAYPVDANLKNTEPITWVEPVKPVKPEK